MKGFTRTYAHIKLKNGMYALFTFKKKKDNLFYYDYYRGDDYIGEAKFPIDAATLQKLFWRVK